MDSKDAKGNASLLRTTKETKWTLDQGGYLSILFGGFVLVGCGLAYVIAVIRGNVEAFLPLISDAAGSPPQNGLFGTLICIGGMFGVMFMILRYLIVMEKNNESSKLVTAVNRLSLPVGIVSMIGITLVTGYPLNFYRNREVWLMDVGFPHMVGGVMLFAFGLVYVALQCVLTLLLGSGSNATLFTRLGLCLAATAAFVYHMLTVPDNFVGVSHLFYMNDTEDVNTTGRIPYPSTLGVDLKLPIDTSGSYVASAVTEWLLVIFFCCFFFTFFNEAQQYSLVVVVETHRTGEEHQELPENRKFSVVRRISVGPQLGLQVETAPAPDARKYLRRDSTCQTTTEDDFVSKNAAKKGSATNGSRKASRDMKLDSNLDAKLNKLLSRMDKENGSQKGQSNGSKTVGHSISTDCEDLANGHSKRSHCNGQSALEKEANKIEVLAEDSGPSKDTSRTSAPFLEGNGKVKKSGSDNMLSSICPLSVS